MDWAYPYPLDAITRTTGGRLTDRELLELAAKAAGIMLDEWVPGLNMGRGAFFLINGDTWNPLTDDGDALRLAVKKSILTENHDQFMRLFYEEIALDKRPSEATRRAIVRAAAAIGKAA